MSLWLPAHGVPVPDVALRSRPARHPSIDRAQPLGSPESILALQRTAGNAAVAAALSRPVSLAVQRQNVGPKATTRHSGTAGLLETFLDPKGGPFTIQIFSLTDDLIGHAWIGAKRGDGQSRTLGFWPNSIYSGLLGPGKLFMPDPHTGEQMHEYEEKVPFNQMERLLGVVERWQGSMYSLLGHHCASFAHEAYTKVTGQNFDPMWDDSIMVWTPAALGGAIDDRKRMEKAVKDRGGPRAEMTVEPSGGTETGSGGEVVPEEAVAEVEMPESEPGEPAEEALEEQAA